MQSSDAFTSAFLKGQKRPQYLTQSVVGIIYLSSKNKVKLFASIFSLRLRTNEVNARSEELKPHFSRSKVRDETGGKKIKNRVLPTRRRRRQQSQEIGYFFRPNLFPRRGAMTPSTLNK